MSFLRSLACCERKSRAHRSSISKLINARGAVVIDPALYLIADGHILSPRGENTPTPRYGCQQALPAINSQAGPGGGANRDSANCPNILTVVMNGVYGTLAVWCRRDLAVGNTDHERRPIIPHGDFDSWAQCQAAAGYVSRRSGSGCIQSTHGVMVARWTIFACSCVIGAKTALKRPSGCTTYWKGRPSQEGALSSV